MKKRRIGVLGWYGHDNCGDESYKLSFRALFPDYDFVFGNSPPPDVDCYVLGGGDVVCEANITMLSKVKKPCYVMSASISRSIGLERFTKVIVRDQMSADLAKVSGVTPILVPDFAFALNANRKRGEELIRKQFKGAELYEKLVIVVLNGNLMTDNGTEEWKALRSQSFFYEIATLADRVNASFLFVPFGISPIAYDDRIANAWSARKCKYWKKNAVVFECLSVQDTIDMLSAADAVLSSRLHSSIFSCSLATPFIDITHNHKNRAFLDTVGLKKLSLDYNGFGFDELLGRLRTLLERPNDFRTELAEVARREKETLGRFSKTFRFT